MMGKFIVLESIEAAGKGTATAYVKEHFKAHGIDCVYTREPGGTPMAEVMREMMLSRAVPMTPIADLLLSYTSRTLHTTDVIIPALEAGRHVFSERYYGSALAYQSQTCPDTQMFHDLIVKHLRKPDLTIFLDISTETSMHRMQETRIAKGIALDKFESKGFDYFEGVRNAYKKQIDDSWIVIDAEQPLENVKEQLCNILNKFLGIP